MARPLAPLLAALLLLCASTAGRADEDPYESILRRNGVSPTRDDIARFLAGLRPTEELESLADELIGRLGDDDFYTREDAEARLLSMPVVPVGKLEAARESTDMEVRFRAGRIIERARDGTRDQILNAALQTVRRVPHTGMTRELLGAMPIMTDAWMRETAARALRATATIEDAERLRAVVASTEAPWIRAAALSSLGAALEAKAADEIATHLEDEDDLVRLSATRTLARLGDRRCVDAYLALLESPEGRLRQRAAADLRAVSGQQFGYVAYGEPKDRAAAVDRWRTWSRAGAIVVLEESAGGFVGRILLCRYSANEVREYDLNGKLLWKKTGMRQPFAGKGTPSGHRLFSLFDENVIVECDASGKETWRSPKLPGFISGLHRLENGNTLAALGHAGRLMEITPAGKIVWNIAVGGSPMEATRLPDGRTLVALNTGAIEIDRSGKRIWSLTAPAAYAAQRLHDGTTVLSHMGSGIAAYSRSGKKLWEVGGLGGLYRGQVLPNGHIVVADSSALKIIDRSGKVLRTIPDTGGTVYVSAY